MTGFSLSNHIESVTLDLTTPQLALLDWHPQFTDRCTNCEMPMAETAQGAAEVRAL